MTNEIHPTAATHAPSDPSALADTIARESAWVDAIRASLSEVIVGQEDLVHGLMIALLTGGHVLLEGLPGLAKTLAVSSLAGSVHGSFARVQFTPDLLPSDLVGTEIYNAKEMSFEARKGPIFVNFLLADEINRAPAKVQSALLEAMQERQVSIGGETFPLPRPFLVLATQNPIEQEGTYRLPEAQVDRFFLKLLVDYPSEEEELEVLGRMATTGPPPEVSPIVDLDTILAARKLVDEIHVDPSLTRYMVRLVRATRDPVANGLPELEGEIQLGASPRASIVLSLASRANAFLEHRGYVTPTDVKRVAPDALRHRVVPSYEAEAEGRDSDQLIARLLETVPVP
ncbi:MAG TPA: MoxR family ATPase [Planctomycetes bacterium]|nr:MoxR family ATPase [Planctomycetota bacterium]